MVHSSSTLEYARTASQAKYQPILQTARQLFESEPDWVTFFREILGVDGIVRRQFTCLEELTAFEKSQEFDQIQKWLVKLREQKNATDTESEPTRVITVRLPKSMHEYLRTEAHDLRTTMNKLCISKLLQVIEQDMIPIERNRESLHAERVDSRQRQAGLRELEELRRQIGDLQASLTRCEQHFAPNVPR